MSAEKVIDPETLFTIARVFEREAELRSLGFLENVNRQVFSFRGEISVAVDMIENLDELDWELNMTFVREYAATAVMLIKRNTPELRDRLRLLRLAHDLRIYAAGGEFETPIARAALAGFELDLCIAADRIEGAANDLLPEDVPEVQELAEVLPC